MNQENITPKYTYTPEKANDIGDRLILFPQYLNSLIRDDEIKDKVMSIAQNHNVAVIVPSRERGKFWDDTGSRIVDKSRIENAVNMMKKYEQSSLTVSISSPARAEPSTFITGIGFPLL